MLPPANCNAFEIPYPVGKEADSIDGSIDGSIHL